MTKNTQENVFLRAAILKGMHGMVADRVAAKLWGDSSESAQYIKAAVSPMTAGPDASGLLTIGTLSRAQFVKAVFSRQILGRIQGLTQVPPITRINFEASPVQAAFAGEGVPLPEGVGNIGVMLADKRKIGTLTVISDELLALTNDTAETTIQGILVRALSRGVDAALVGAQARGDVSPAGLASVATPVSGATLTDAFAAGVDTFTGDLMTASVLVNPLTAVTLRSPTESLITANGGQYGGLPAVTSYGVPAGTLFIVDASRIVAAVGDVAVEVSSQASVIYGAAMVNAFQTGQRAVRCIQYVDWQFLPGVAVQCQAGQS
jgi:hypothetical protein